MYAANSSAAVLTHGAKRNGMVVGGIVGRNAVSLAGRVITALVLAMAVWIGLMLAAATVGRVVPELVQWVGVLVLGMLGSEIRVPLSVVPHALAQLTAVWPAFHVGQLARYAAANGGIDLVPHVVGVAGLAVLFFVLARRGLRQVR